MRRTRILVALFAVAACGGGDAPQVPTVLEASGSTAITATVGTQAGTAPSVTVRDASGKGVSGVNVKFTATGGGKPAVDSARTAGNGVASSGGWTLGTASGTQTLTATAAGLSPVTFTANVAAGVAVRLQRTIADPQQGVVNTNVPIAPSARALDQYDNPVPGVSVTFNVLNGGGSVVGGTKTTGADGIAAVDSWKLGTTAGQQLLRADAAGVSIPAAFSATARAGAAEQIAIVAGNNVSGVTGAPLASFATLPTVKVTDAFGNAVANVTVTFTPGPNSGTVTGATVVSNDAGIAVVGGWTLGDGASQTLIASSPAIPGVQAVFNVTAQVTQFNIEVRWVASATPSARVQLAVQRSIDKWRSVLVSNSGTTLVNLGAGDNRCGRSWLPATSEQVTNLLIHANVLPIDGAFGTAGNAGPCNVFHNTGLPAVGTMLLDVADLLSLEASGIIDALVFHEMGHALGFGSLWGIRGVIADPTPGSNDPIFTGVTARAQFQLIGGNLYSGRPVPVANVGGAGTENAHWRESIFGSEVMTGTLNNGFNPLSRATIGSMQDIGYQVSYTAADGFSINPGVRISPLLPGIDLGNDVFETPYMAAQRRTMQLFKPPQR